MKKGKRAIVLAIAIALGLLAACGHGSARQTTYAPDASAQLQSATQEALAQLDALAKPDGVDAALWDELVGAFRTALQARTDKITSTPPTGEANRINELAVKN